MGKVTDWLFGTVEAAPSAPTVTAAAGRVALATRGTHGQVPWGINSEHLLPFEFTGVTGPWWSREAAMSLPTISRCRDLICSAVGALGFGLWSEDRTTAAVPPPRTPLPPTGWMDRPDPDRTRQWMLSWTVDDLFFYQAAHWLVTDRYAAPNDYPRSFRRIPPGDLHVSDSGVVTVGDTEVAARDVVEFLSPVEGLLANGYRAISIALQLDDAADRFAATEVPAGVLEEQEGSEDMDADELRRQAEQFAEARHSNTIAALNKYMRYREIPGDASKMQLVEGRTYQALELARLGNVPPYLVGAPAGTGMTYQNAETARRDLIDYGALPYLGCIEQTLSGPNVTPRGQVVTLDLEGWLRSPFTDAGNVEPDPGVPTPEVTP